jgi:hypothetical protein
MCRRRQLVLGEQARICERVMLSRSRRRAIGRGHNRRLYRIHRASSGQVMWSANRGARAAGAESAAGAEHVAHRLAVDVAAQNQVVAQSRFYPRRDRLPS